MVDPKNRCFVCNDERIEADEEFEGKPVHSWHLSEFQRTAVSSRAIEKEETKMGRFPRTDVDLIAYKADYEAGMSASDLERKYVLGQGTTSKWAHKAGCIMRGSGYQRDAHRTNGSHPHPKLHRKTAIVKAAPKPAVILSEAKDLALPANGTGNGHTRCRVAMFEVEGDQAAVLAAIEAVKTALSRAA
jgi:hypothetical protein